MKMDGGVWRGSGVDVPDLNFIQGARRPTGWLRRHLLIIHAEPVAFCALN